jgi:hypothetical protein
VSFRVIPLTQIKGRGRFNKRHKPVSHLNSAILF